MGSVFQNKIMLVPKGFVQMIPQTPTLLSESIDYRLGIYAGGILSPVPHDQMMDPSDCELGVIVKL
jgi:hypothetical protein